MKKFLTFQTAKFKLHAMGRAIGVPEVQEKKTRAPRLCLTCRACGGRGFSVKGLSFNHHEVREVLTDRIAEAAWASGGVETPGMVRSVALGRLLSVQWFSRKIAEKICDEVKPSARLLLSHRAVFGRMSDEVRSLVTR